MRSFQLAHDRGASDATIRLYARDVARLLMALGDDPATWDAAAVRTTFMDLASTSGRGTIEKMTTSLRAFLRYLAVEGRCPAGLDSAVPAYAHWRLADMPRYLATEQVNCLIAACNGEAPARRRDRAIILLLVRLGLRAGDVAQLRLDDIEWETGSLRVAGKSRTEVRLPLPQDVGDAIAAYVDCRPKHHASAHVFLRTIAPYRSFRRGDGISSLVTAIDWAALGPSVAQRDARLKAVCRFVRHVRIEDGRHELPPANHFGAHKRRRPPHIYSDAEFNCIIEAALRLGPKGGLRSLTYATLIALLSATGLRISEARPGNSQRCGRASRQ